MTPNALPIKEDSLQIDAEFQGLIRANQIRFTRFFIYVLGDKQITLPQYYVLATLTADGALPMSQVAKRLHISKPAVTHLVDRLEKSKLISRKAAPDDRRIFLLEPTEKGASLVKSVQKQFYDFLGKALVRLTAKDRDVLKNFYKVIGEEFDKMISHAAE